MTVIGFKSKNDKHQDSIIEKLEHYLELAKHGKVRTLMVVATLESGGVQTGCVGDWLPVLGALRVAERQLIDSSEEVDPE